ncbi:glycosyltransferase 87 family protein [Streptomyces sp. NPDC001153]
MRAGGDLNALRATAAHLPTTYPPFAALLFTPLTLLDPAPLRVPATAGNLALLVAFVRLSLKLVGHARVDAVWWVAAPAAAPPGGTTPGRERARGWPRRSNRRPRCSRCSCS